MKENIYSFETKNFKQESPHAHSTMSEAFMGAIQMPRRRPKCH